jgi:hypothetical protein
LEFCVLIAVIGGGIASLLFALCFILANYWIRRVAREPQPTSKDFIDAVIVIAISVVPQSALAAIPWIYIGPGEIPAVLSVPCVMAACVMTVLWFWALLKVLQAAATAVPRGINRIVLALPLLVSLTFFVGLIVGRFR